MVDMVSTPSVTVFRSVAVVEAGSLWLFASSVVGSVVSPPQPVRAMTPTSMVAAIRTERNFFIGITSFHFTSALPRRFFCARRGENALHYTQYSQKMQVLFSKKSRRNRMK